MKKLFVRLAGLAGVLFTTGMAMAQEHAATTVVNGSYTNAIYAIVAGLAIAISAAFGVLAQSRAAATALEGISRNPGAASKVQTPMIIALALIESLVIYALVIAFLLQGKIA